MDTDKGSKPGTLEYGSLGLSTLHCPHCRQIAATHFSKLRLLWNTHLICPRCGAAIGEPSEQTGWLGYMGLLGSLVAVAGVLLAAGWNDELGYWLALVGFSIMLCGSILRILLSPLVPRIWPPHDR
jgi:hypothetical protein